MKIYLDTSVIGGLFDDEFHEWTIKLFDELSSGRHIAVISDLTLEELSKAPEFVKNALNNVPDAYLEYILLNDEAIELSNHYIKERIVGKKSLIDSRHIAISTVNKVDVLVSWNFKHIVNFNKIRLYNSVNMKYGYSLLEIRTPREVIHEK